MAKSPDDDLRTRMREAIANPFLQLPVEWVPLVFDFWSCFAHLLKPGEGELALCSQVRWMMAEDGLTLPELEAAFKAVRHPSVSAGLRYPSEVLAAVSEAIDKARHLRREADHKRERAEYLARVEATPRATPEEVAAIVRRVADGLPQMGDASER